MRRTARILAAFATLALVLGPALAEARPGGGSSSGSRGSRSFSPPPVTRTAPDAARPMDRTMTQPSRPTSPGMAGATQPQRGGMFGGFGGALMGGLIGAGLFGLLSGSGLFGGLSGLGGILGLLIQIALVVLVVRFAMKWWRNRNQPAMAGGPRPNPMQRDMPQGMARQAHGMGGMGAASAAASQGTPLAITDSDYRAFDALLREVNQAWSARDLQGLSRIATPEMVGYFAQDLRDLEARGWHNQTRDVQLEQGDLSEAWSEGQEEYATVAMRFSLIDVTTDRAGQVVEGHPTQRSSSTELWTFVRGPAGRWKLSAIQQTGR